MLLSLRAKEMEMEWKQFVLEHSFLLMFMNHSFTCEIDFSVMFKAHSWFILCNLHN